MGERVIRVTGKGRLRVRPDMTRITMTLEDVKKDYDKECRDRDSHLCVLT